MDKLVIVRSLIGNQADHDAIQVYNGHHPAKLTPPGGWPQLGSAVAKLQGTADAVQQHTVVHHQRALVSHEMLEAVDPCSRVRTPISSAT